MYFLSYKPVIGVQNDVNNPHILTAIFESMEMLEDWCTTQCFIAKGLLNMFITVLKGFICFSKWFYNNSLIIFFLNLQITSTSHVLVNCTRPALRLRVYFFKQNLLYITAQCFNPTWTFAWLIQAKVASENSTKKGQKWHWELPFRSSSSTRST